MRTILYLIRKEFLQILRNKFISKAIFAVPIVQMLILVPAVTFELKNVKLAVIDKDMTPESRGLISKISGSTFFKISFLTFSDKEAYDLLNRNKCSVIFQIPSGFGKDIVTGKRGKLLAVIDAVNASSAEISWAYLNGAIADYNTELIRQDITTNQLIPATGIEITNRYWYNELLNYKFYMLPGILVILVTAIGFLLAGLNMVREKEIGTIEQINVTPIHKYEFIAGKLIPFWIIALFELAFGLTLAKLVFNIPIVGSLELIFGVASVYLIAIMSLGLFISTLADTQQQSMFLSWFCMVIFILMSGLFTPIDSMPEWAKAINIINPIHYFIPVMRNVMLKGSNFADISKYFWPLVCYGFISISLAVWRYRKTS